MKTFKEFLNESTSIDEGSFDGKVFSEIAKGDTIYMYIYKLGKLEAELEYTIDKKLSLDKGRNTEFTVEKEKDDILLPTDACKKRTMYPFRFPNGVAFVYTTYKAEDTDKLYTEVVDYFKRYDVGIREEEEVDKFEAQA